jgi:tetratricopeptide (TPR) repeat protein
MADLAASPDPTAAPEPRLPELARTMTLALKLRADGRNDDAKKLLKEILAVEPRLAEPRLELAWIAAAKEDWEEAEEQARLAVEILEAGGQWSDDLDPDQMLSFALTLLGEVIVRPLEEGDLFLVDRAEFTEQWNEAAELFARAVKLDEENEDARRNRSRYRPIVEN